MKPKRTKNIDDDIFMTSDHASYEEDDDRCDICDEDYDCMDNVEDLFEESLEHEEDPCDDSMLSYKDYAVKKSSTKKVSSQNYESADLYSQRQDIVLPSDCIDNSDYFNEDLEKSACCIIKGTSLDKYTDGRYIPIKDVVSCFVRLADKWPDDMVYCFVIIACYGKVLRYKSLLDAIPTLYRDKLISQLSPAGAAMIKSLYKKEATMIDIFC